MFEQIGSSELLTLGTRSALTNREERSVQAAVQQAVWDYDAHWRVKLDRAKSNNRDKSRQILSVFLGLLGPEKTHLHLVVTIVPQAGEISLQFTLRIEKDRTSPVVDLPKSLELQDAMDLIDKVKKQITYIEGLIAA